MQNSMSKIQFEFGTSQEQDAANDTLADFVEKFHTPAAPET